MGRGVIVILFGILLLCSSAIATTVDLSPLEVPSNTNKEFNLTLNNHGDREAIDNITIESKEFKITNGFGGEEWVVTTDSDHVHWHNSTLGTTVVYALFPFRATAPSVVNDTEINFTITLLGKTRVQRLRLPVIVRAPVVEKEIFTVKTEALKRGEENTLEVTSSESNLSGLSVMFLGKSYTLTKTDSSYSTTIPVDSGATIQDTQFTIRGSFEGREFTQNAFINVIDPISLSLDVPSGLNTSSTFILRGSLDVSNKSAYSGKPVTILWQNQETKVSLDNEAEFVGALIGPGEAGEYSIKVQFEQDGFIYTQTATIPVTDLIEEVTPEPVEEKKEVEDKPLTTDEKVAAVAAKAAASNSRNSIKSDRSRVAGVSTSSRSAPKRSYRPYVAVFLIILCFLLFAYAYKNISVGPTKKEEEEEEDDKPTPRYKTIKWDEYFEQRRKEKKLDDDLEKE